MVHAIVQPRDGFSTGRVWLRSVVRNIQSGLVESGLDVDEDGRFGSGTEAALRTFQERVGVSPTGVTNRATWNQLESAVIAALDRRQPDVVAELPTFRGDLDWVHDQEGYKGQPYWPGGVSGVTLDPGVDLGHVNPDLVERVYQSFLSDVQHDAVTRVFGIKGPEADRALEADDDLKSIHLTREQAERLLPFAARGYWDAACRRFLVLERQATLPAVQTVLLSLAYNRGADNPDLEKLAAPLDRRQWTAVADLVGAMQPHHEVRGIQLRRQYEANLIRAELRYLST